eukprot:2769163-Rhodomonas_salina.1
MIRTCKRVGMCANQLLWRADRGGSVWKTSAIHTDLVVWVSAPGSRLLSNIGNFASQAVKSWRSISGAGPFLPTFLPTFLHTFLHTFLPYYLPTYLPTYVDRPSSYLTYRPTYLSICRPTYLPTWTDLPPT